MSSNPRYPAVVETGKFALSYGKNRVVCPVCRGGTDGEACLSIWEAGAYVFATCHRANCDVGTVVIQGSAHPREEDGEEPRRAPPTDHSYELDHAAYRRFNEQYEFDFSQDCAWRYIKMTRTALYFPILNADGARCGVIVRPFEPRGPKALTFVNDGYCGLSWYVQHLGLEQADVYVVEDCVSALALYDIGVDAISLNGTGLSRVRYDAIMDRKSRIILMLDADATRKALSICNQFGPDRIRVVRLLSDVKNMTRSRVMELLDSVN